MGRGAGRNCPQLRHVHDHGNGLYDDVDCRWLGAYLARRLFPQIKLLDYAAAVRLALANLETGYVETAWSDALASSQGDVCGESEPIHAIAASNASCVVASQPRRRPRNGIR